MLAIRMQRTGRKGHAQFRVVVQDSRQTPTSARVVAALGSYNPHTKAAILDTEKVTFYLQNGAQPSDRVVKLLKDQGVALPAWVNESAPRTASIRHAEKLRKNQPKASEAPAEETPAEEVSVESDAATAEA